MIGKTSLLMISLFMFVGVANAEAPVVERSVSATDIAIQASVKLDTVIRTPEAVGWMEQWCIASGFFISNTTIITAAHTIGYRMDTEIKVTDVNNNVYQAYVVDLDEANDIAVLQLMNKDVKHMSLEFAKGVKLGQEVLSVGIPKDKDVAYDMSFSVVDGHISRFNTITGGLTKVGRTQIDMTIYNGFSGAPIVNLDGEVVGMVVEYIQKMPSFTLSFELSQMKQYIADVNTKNAL